MWVGCEIRAPVCRIARVLLYWLEQLSSPRITCILPGNYFTAQQASSFLKSPTPPPSCKPSLSRKSSVDLSQVSMLSPAALSPASSSQSESWFKLLLTFSYIFALVFLEAAVIQSVNSEIWMYCVPKMCKSHETPSRLLVGCMYSVFTVTAFCICVCTLCIPFF